MSRGTEALRARVAAAAEESAAQGHELIAECVSCNQLARFYSQADRMKWSAPHMEHQLYHYIRDEELALAA